MSVIFWDTNLFIYLIEQTPELHDRVVNIRREMTKNGDQLATSVLTLGEILVKPIQESRPDLVDQYKSLLTGPHISLIHFDETVALKFSEIRAQYGKRVRPPDAIQLACAGTYGVERFITNDDRLSGISVDGIGSIEQLIDY